MNSLGVYGAEFDIQDRLPFELPFIVALKISGKKLTYISDMREVVMFG